MTYNPFINPKRTCLACLGTGHTLEPPIRDCPDCAGTGRTATKSRPTLDAFA